jgi:hypothetical protein
MKTILTFVAGTAVALFTMWGVAGLVVALRKSPVSWDEVVFSWIFIVVAVVIYKFAFSRHRLYR